MEKICLINGSLRGKKAASLVFLNEISNRLCNDIYKKDVITVKATINGNYAEDQLKIIAGSDVIILIFPLFVYSLPGALMRLLEDYYLYIKNNNKYNKDAFVYAIINCGFPEPGINSEAIRVIRNFCKRLGLNWRFALSIGCGPIAVLMMKIPFIDMKIKRAFIDVIEDIKDNEIKRKDDILIKSIISKVILLKIKDRFEKKVMSV